MDAEFAADEDRDRLPRTVADILAGIENGTLVGITAREFVQLFQTISSSMTATMRIVDMAAQSQKGAQENINDAITAESEALTEIARNLETDSARLEFTKLYLEREKEKTKQAEIAKEVNNDNNTFYGGVLVVCSVIGLGALKALSNVRKII